MSKQTIIVDGHALTTEAICHIAGQSWKLRLADATVFIGTINKGIASLSVIDTRPALESHE